MEVDRLLVEMCGFEVPVTHVGQAYFKQVWVIQVGPSMHDSERAVLTCGEQRSRLCRPGNLSSGYNSPPRQPTAEHSGEHSQSGSDGPQRCPKAVAWRRQSCHGPFIAGAQPFGA